MENALASGLFEDEGIVLISGTGMVAYGKNKFSETHKAGGLGYKEGDLGSAYDLGLKAIQAASRALDNRYDMTPFTKEVIETLRFNISNDVIDFMEVNRENRTFIASLAPIVTKHGDLGDEYAKEICDSAVDELVLAVCAVQRRLQFEHPQLVIVGTLGNDTHYFRNTLFSKLMVSMPELEVFSPKLEPNLAACNLSLNNSVFF
ncbi:hypothetical protein N7603_00320 [Acholeplasma vituli]|uniref:ATPase BadF/BadG/BcrA/BcrD type domain-containing protein n=1 Tax=Paracholeplasma vituli TaxID=69473 RepID=A0ABT2PUU5_9MOLU|nr:BadF/BadG/BcrA/BcrD ATPase family protein [Paracholeplasma vituli]MCU0104104.1 hypothetical protein [Paracholeplasma vituli]